MPEFTTKLFAPADEECIIKRASTYEYFLYFYTNAGRQGVARQTEWRQKLPDFWYGGSILHIGWKYVHRTDGGEGTGNKGALNVMKTTAAKNHLARAAPRCRPNGKWSTV